MLLSASDFAAFHQAVHNGRAPFAWQERLLEQIIRDQKWPDVLDLPTGAGKTTCIDIALFALALDAVKKPEERWCPRRIAMVVDRRIVVDQAAERGRKLLQALMTSADPVLKEVKDRLCSLTRTGEEPLGVFTLRGGMPKDDGWARTPDQPLVIASTVDQIGSRMLMQGYGVSSCMQPVHAGLLANDTLLLLDEVHLSEPFRQTLDQLGLLRTRFSDRGLRTRFAHVFLSATPEIIGTATFSLADPEKDPASPLGPRLHASKPTRLVEVEDREALEKACADQAKDLLQRHRTIAVIVNRVKSARKIARKLKEMLGQEATVTLLTGRMRPLDRDDVLRELRPYIQTGRERYEDSPKRVIVGTQCLEAGADFDFDALVTEAASFDSLRQRFGRVDRLGLYGQAEGVIIYDKSSRDDPIYGSAVLETIKWFKAQGKERPKKLKDELKSLKDEAKKLKGDAKLQVEAQIARKSLVDFGVLALDVPTGDERKELLAPKPNAPTLLPAYLDLWAQTSPAPRQLPDVGLWLHGPSTGPAEVQVVWRADLNEEMLRRGDVETATAIVAAVRPSSLEAMSLPFPTVRAWLAKQPTPDIADTEGAMSEDADEPKTEGRRALRWRGSESEIIDAKALKPGDTIVVPSAYGGIHQGCFDPAATEAVLDCAERAALIARAQPILRLHPAVAEHLGLTLSLDDPEQSRAELGALATNAAWPAWKRLWAEHLAQGRASFVVAGDPAWTVIQSKRISMDKLRQVLGSEDSIELGADLTTDVEDSFCAGRAVTLSEHSANVETFAREYAARCGLGAWLTEHIALAAWLHDIGKADPRFQLMLRGGSEIEYFKDETPWAKSPIPAGARGMQRKAQQKSGYPKGARHEVQSLSMLQDRLKDLQMKLKSIDPSKDVDLDLVLHLVASHHGYCRPFAPVSCDDTPVKVALAKHTSATFGEMDFAETSSKNDLHRLDSPLADRFWALIERYGWQELCWLEAILRLADHRASEDEQTKEVLP